MSIYSGAELKKYVDTQNFYFAGHQIDLANKFRDDEDYMLTEEDGFVLIDNVKTKYRFRCFRIDSTANVLTKIHSKNKPVYRKR